MQPRRLTEQPDLLGESPFWHPAGQCLYWIDIPGCRLHRLTLSGEQSSWDLPAEPGCMAPAVAGGLIIALRSGVAHFDTSNGALDMLADAPYDPATMRFNDGCCDTRGRFWAGTLFAPKSAPAAGLYCLTRTGAPAPARQWEMVRHLDGVVTANGLAFSPDGRTAYWSDSPEHLIRRFPYDPDRARFGSPEAFMRFARRAEGVVYGGRPDGAAVDSEGNYWVAMYEGARVLQIAPDGRLLLEVALPVRCPTMVCLGGAGLRTLYITTARKGRPPEELAAEPLAGHLLSIELDALPVAPTLQGRPVVAFDPAA